MRHPQALLLALVVPLLLAGCSTPASIASSTYPDVPDGYAETVNLFSAEPIAVWVHGKTLLAIVTVGSGSCPPVPTSISAPDATTIDVTFVKSPNSPCSADLGPTTHEFTIPEGVNPTDAVTVNLHFDFDTDQDYELTVK